MLVNVEIPLEELDELEPNSGNDSEP